MASGSFKRLVSALPVSWESALGRGLSFLAEELDATEMKLDVRENGVSIHIKCDAEGRKKAALFWRDHVQDKLD